MEIKLYGPRSDSFVIALDDAAISYEEIHTKHWLSWHIQVATGDTIIISGDDAVWLALAKVINVWIQAREKRSVRITLEDNRSVQVKEYSAQVVARLLQVAKHIYVFDANKDLFGQPKTKKKK